MRYDLLQHLAAAAQEPDCSFCLSPLHHLQPPHNHLPASLPTTLRRRRRDIRHQQAVRGLAGEVEGRRGECVRGVAGGEVGVEGWWRFAQTACGLQGGREAEIILRSQAFSPLSISRRGPLCIILGARLARISAVTETKVISLAFRTTGRWPKITNLLFYHHIISPCREKLITPMTLIFKRFIMYIY